tara:strand:+ start:123 stop:344 length:222 start_codon:yes stop_codon:yes gene_type:complete
LISTNISIGINIRICIYVGITVGIIVGVSISIGVICGGSVSSIQTILLAILRASSTVTCLIPIGIKREYQPQN